MLFICFQLVISIMMLIPKASNFASILQYQAFTYWLSAGMVIAALLWLRYKRPEMDRPYKVLLYSIGLLLGHTSQNVYVNLRQMMLLPRITSTCISYTPDFAAVYKHNEF